MTGSRLSNFVAPPLGVEDFGELVSAASRVIVFHPLAYRNLPLFEMLQHIALSLALQGCQYVYCTRGQYDGVQKKYKPVPDLPLYVTSYGWVIEEVLQPRADAACMEKLRKTALVNTWREKGKNISKLNAGAAVSNGQ